MNLKSYVKRAIGARLPSLLRHYDLKTRVEIIRAAISEVNLVANLPATQQLDLLVDCLRGAGIAGLLHRGSLGSFCGLTEDESVHRQYVYTNDWSPIFHSFMRRSVFTDGVGTYVDIGANIGLTVIPIAKLGRIKCIAVEPTPVNYRLLRANAFLNDVGDGISFHNVAAMSAPGTVSMKLSGWNSGDHQVMTAPTPAATDESPGSQPIEAEVRVPAARIDDLVFAGEELQHPLVCKIDTQGAEVEVLRGGSRLIEEADLMVIEYWPAGLRRLGGDVATLLEMLGRGFRYAALTKLDSDSHQGLTSLRPAEEVFREALQLAVGAKDVDYWDLVVSKRQIGAGE